MNTQTSALPGHSGEAPALAGDELRQLLLLTQRMVMSAEKDDWDEVARLDEERVLLLNSNSAARASVNGYGSGNTAVPPATDIDLTADLISADAEVLRMAREYRDKLGGEGSRLQAQRSARDHYADAQRLR